MDRRDIGRERLRVAQRLDGRLVEARDWHHDDIAQRPLQLRVWSSRQCLSNAPADTPLLTLAQVAAARWVIQTEFETAKGETGLDEYEVRSWAGWHHHLTLALLAGAFLLTLQQDWGEKDAPDDAAPSQSGAARAAAAPDVDARRVAPVARRYPRAQRTRQTVTPQASSPQAA